MARLVGEAHELRRQAAVQAANGLQACGHWTDAVSVLIKALERHPDAPTIVSNLSRACSEVGDFSRAAQYLRSFLDRDPRDTSQWLQLGDLYFQAGDLEDAAFSYGKILSAEPLNIRSPSCNVK